MADHPLGSLGIQIREHWKRHRPQMYAELEKSGHLLESVYAAQELTNDLMDDLLQKHRNSSRFPVWRVTPLAVHRGATFRRCHDGRCDPTASDRSSPTRSR